MTTVSKMSLRSGAIATLSIVTGSLVLAGTAVAAKPGDKGLFDRETAPSPFLLSIERPDAWIEATGVVEGEDGTLWVTGSVGCQNGEVTCGYLAEVTPDGALAAEHEIEMPGIAVTEFWWPAVTADGRIVVTATLEPYTPDSEGALLMFDSNGNLADQFRFSDFGNSGGELLHVVPHANGDLALTGSMQIAPDQFAALTLRVDSALNVIWQHTENARERDFSLSGYVSSVMPDGSVIAIGTASDAEYYETYGWVARFDADGNQLWRKWLTGGLLDLMGETVSIYGNWVDVLPNGNIAYLQAGFNDWGEPTSNLLVEIDADGTIVRQTPLALGNNSTMFALAGMRNGDVVVTGDIDAQHPLIARIDPTGSVLWSVELDDLYGAFPWGIIEGSDGSVIAIGVHQPSDLDTSGWVVRLGPDGSQL